MKLFKILKIIPVLLLLFCAAAFAQNSSVISPNLKRAAERSSKLAKSVSDAKIRVLFYPEDKNSDNIDLSFFHANNIDYAKSRSFLTAEIPLRLIDGINKIRGVRFADLSFNAKPMGVISEGANAINASKYLFNNVTGQGVKIAVVDVGFQGYRNLIASGELPVNVSTQNFTSAPAEPFESDIHGSACAEIVYDIAPGAKLYLLKVGDEASFQEAYDYCVSTGIHIITASIGWSFTGDSFVDGTSFAADILDSTGTANNILSVVAAGNEAQISWMSMFEDYEVSGSTTGWMKFGSGNDYIDVSVPYNISLSIPDVVFVWDDFNAMDKDYALYIYDQNGTFIESTEGVWIPGYPPVVYFYNDTGYTSLRFKIKKNNNYNNVALRLLFNSPLQSGYYSPVNNSLDRNSQSSLSSPGDARTALTVGAINVANWGNGPIQVFSSRGPTMANSAFSYAFPSVQKPDICGPDGVTTVSYGPKNFEGTSAATPHIAGAAALLLSLDTTLSTNTANGKFKNYVLGFAKQVASSPDNTYGRGKLVLDVSDLPYDNAGDIICYPNPASISKKGYIKFTNFPFNTGLIEVNVFTVMGEFVKSFGPDDAQADSNGRRTITWNLKNQNGSQIAPGIYFVTINTPASGKKVKKIAIQK
ncbi:MAG: S8 family serine peptidase [Endomicrobia bacterium]|nr:S8 family serine peptidase [Endomicrobiia bacterium]MCL2799197.1 S8 family serine peptidase [Endomicrobiia bacterium]